MRLLLLQLALRFVMCLVLMLLSAPVPAPAPATQRALRGVSGCVIVCVPAPRYCSSPVLL